MAIVVNLDVVMAQRKISASELAARIQITPANLSILKNNKARAIRFSTLEAICRTLQCTPGDLLECIPDETDKVANNEGSYRHVDQ
ncbi:MAG: helix-turn-helix transcriptional regulator [Sporolactobacillus sp.]